MTTKEDMDRLCETLGNCFMVSEDFAFRRESLPSNIAEAILVLSAEVKDAGDRIGDAISQGNQRELLGGIADEVANIASAVEDLSGVAEDLKNKKG
jgi:hypothetical protein